MDELVQTYIIQLRAITIDKTARKQSNRFVYSTNLLIQLVLSDQKNLLAQSSWSSTEVIQGTIKCHNATLRVNPTFHSQQSQQWTLTILGKEQQDQSQSLHSNNMHANNISNKRAIKKLGEGHLNASIYAQTLKDCGKFKFQEHMQISNNLSLCYEVYIATSLECLEDILIREQQRKEAQIIDTAFKKLPGNPKIRYVELKQNREKSIKSEQFLLNEHRKIASLKKSGTKYVPVPKQPSYLQEPTRYKELRREKQPEASKRPSSQTSRYETIANEPSKQNQRQLHKAQSNIEEKPNSAVKRGQINCYYVLILLMATLVGGYMMFPSKKI